MEIRVRQLLALVIVSVLAASGVFLVPRLTRLLAGDPRPFAPLAPPDAPNAAAPTPLGSESMKVAVSYIDHSIGWDWQVTCAASFQQFLARELAGQAMRAVRVELVDDKADVKLPFGTTYRGARVNGNCFNQRGEFTCQMAVAAGDAGPDLDTAATFNVPYTLLDMFLAHGPNPNAVRATWTLSTFQPLLTPAEEANRWHSACLKLSRVR